MTDLIIGNNICFIVNDKIKVPISYVTQQVIVGLFYQFCRSYDIGSTLVGES